MKRQFPIPPLTPETASAEALQAVKEHEAEGGRMTNMKWTLLRSVPLFEAMNRMMATADAQLKGRIPQRALIFFLYAVTQGNDCMVCGTVFRKIVLEMGIEDFASFEFTEEERELLAFAEALTKDANHIPDAVYEPLRRRYDPDTLVILMMNAVMTMASNYFNNITGVELDEELRPWYPG